MAKFLEDIPLLVAALAIVVVAMIFLIVGIRGTAFESFCMVLAFVIAFVLVAIAHAVSFTFRNHALTAANLTFAILLIFLGILYLYYFCRLCKLQPPKYAKTRADDTESSVALTGEPAEVEKTIKSTKSGFTDLNRGMSDQDYARIKREVELARDGPEVEIKRESYNKLQSGNTGNLGNNTEKEFVAVKRVLLNEGQKGLDNIREGVERDYGNIKNTLGDIKKEYRVVRKEVSNDVDRLLDDVKGHYLEKELSGSFKSGLGDIDKEFNIFQREFGGNSGGGNVQRVVSSIRKGFQEEFKSGGENVRREIVEVKRDEHGNITSYIERRLTDSGVEISSVSVDRNRAPMANFTN